MFLLCFSHFIDSKSVKFLVELWRLRHIGVVLTVHTATDFFLRRLIPFAVDLHILLTRML